MAAFTGDILHRVIFGTAQDDSIFVSFLGINRSLSYEFNGLGGDDFITDGDANDTLSGGDGDDIIFASNGNDLINGGPGNDAIAGGLGNDTIAGGPGNDRILIEDDVFQSLFNPLIVDFSLGDDIRVVDNGLITRLINVQSDITEPGAIGLRVIGGTTRFLADTNGNAIPDNIFTVSGVFNAADLQLTRATATAVAISIIGPPLPTLTLSGSAVPEGNAGITNAVFTVTLSAPSAVPVSVQFSTSNGTALAGSDYTAASGTLTIPAGQVSGSILVSVTSDSTIENDETFNVTISNPVGATIAGLPAVLGTITNDDIPTFNGVIVTGDAANNFLVGSERDDSIDGAAGDDTLFGLDGSDTVQGGAGGDFIVSGTFFEVGSDVVDAGDGNNFVFGGGGNDLLTGGIGNDLLAGEPGNDTISGGPGDNALYGGDGNDSITGGDQGDIVFGELGRDVITTFGGFDLIIGDGNDIGDSDSIDAGAGGDFVFAGIGDDTLLGGAGPDFMLGENGSDSMSGGSEDDFLPGGAGPDTIDGGTGNDLVLGEDGSDRLIGGPGNDLLVGGPGADLLVYPDASSVGNDVIADFVPVDDTVQLSATLGLTAAQALAALTQSGQDTLLTLGGSGTIKFAGIAPAAFSVADFVIV